MKVERQVLIMCVRTGRIVTMKVKVMEGMEESRLVNTGSRLPQEQHPVYPVDGERLMSLSGQLPGGKSSKDFLREKARLYRASATNSTHAPFAHKAIAIMDHLLLQRPFHKSKSKDHIKCLFARLKLWKEGNIAQLLRESSELQHRFVAQRRVLSMKADREDDDEAYRFAQLIFEGDERRAHRMLDAMGGTGVQELTPEVRQTLSDIHFADEPARESALLKGPVLPIPDAVFDSITGAAIKDAALRTRGGAGPSGANAKHWKEQLTSFGDISRELCDAMADFTRTMCTEFMTVEELEAFLANRVVPLDKNPGTRPIGVGEVPRRIVAKVVLVVAKDDIKEAAANTNLCVGQEAAVEALFRHMQEVFAGDDCDAILLVDAEQGFQRLNRKVTLHNIKYICPILFTMVVNVYRGAARAVVALDFELESREGVTMGCPLAMTIYGLALVPLIEFLRSECGTEPTVSQSVCGASFAASQSISQSDLSDLERHSLQRLRSR